MKLVTFQRGENVLPGMLVGSEVHSLANAAASVLAIVQSGMTPDQLRQAAGEGARYDLQSVRILAPIPSPPRNIFCVGKNYVEHAIEFAGSGFDAAAVASAVPELPIIFTKATTSVSGPGEQIRAERDFTNSMDYEGELAVVIGVGGQNISRQKAMKHVFGYTIVNDLTSRELQKTHKQWFLGKSLDGFCPMGPVLVTKDEIENVGELQILTHVNGELRQKALVSDLIFDIPCLIETISRLVTLMPGDIIATGTPQGVGIGFTPPKFLKAGDVVTVSISQIGEISNEIR